MDREGTVAIIDDNAMVRQGIQRLVDSLNFRTKTFSSADDFFAFDLLPNVRCIISDVHMVGSDARQFQNRLNAVGCVAPVIFITALPNCRLKAELLDAGAFCVLGKPFHSDEIARCIAIAILQRNTEPGQKSDEATL